MSSALSMRSIVIRAYFISIVINISSNGQSTPTTGTLPRGESSKTERYKVVCNLQEWGSLRYLPEHSHSTSCTHVVLGYATLDETRLTMKPKQSWLNLDNPFYDLLRSYKQRGIKVLLGFGGWDDSAGDKYSRMVSNTTSRRAFVAHALGFIEANGFDGLDLLWHWPVCWRSDCTAGPASDKEGFSLLVEELSSVLRPNGLSLSAVVSPIARHMDLAYNFTVLAQHLDWISVKAYDYFGYWDGRTGHTAPLYDHPDLIYHSRNVNTTINRLISKGIPPRQIVLGISFHGRAFTIKNLDKGVGLNVPANVEEEGSILLYYEICELIHSRNWTVVKDPVLRMGPYAYRQNKWVSFDDAEMVGHKAEYVRDMHLGGAMVMNLEHDDFLGTCGEGKHPLMHTLLQILSAPL